MRDNRRTLGVVRGREERKGREISTLGVRERQLDDATGCARTIFFFNGSGRERQLGWELGKGRRGGGRKAMNEGAREAGE